MMRAIGFTSILLVLNIQNSKSSIQIDLYKSFAMR